jgi:hypothetical protein
MLIARSKAESRYLIEKLNLNRVPEIFIDNKDYDAMKKFIELNKSTLYIIRDAENPNGKYYYFKSYEECISISNEYNGRIILAISINSFTGKILLGTAEFSFNKVNLCATTNPLYDHRTIYSYGEINISTTIFDKSLDEIPGFTVLLDYIERFNLFNIIIEFTIYSNRVGINNEYIIINELRSY